MDREENELLNQNPWKDREACPAVPGALTAAFFGVFLISALTIPLSDRQPAALALWLMLAVGGLALTRRGISGGTIAVLLSLPLMLIPVWGTSLGVLFLAATVGIMSGAWLFTTGRNPVLPIAGATAAGLIAYFVTRDLRISLLALGLLPAVFLLGWATFRCERRSVAVIYAATGLLLSFLAVAGWYLYSRLGTVSGETIRALSEVWKGKATDGILAWRDQLIRTIGKTAATSSAGQVSSMQQILEQQVSDEAVGEIVAAYFLLLPGAILVLCEGAAFFAQKMLNAAYTSSGWSRVLMPENEFFTVGLPAAVLYVVAFFITSFGSTTATLFFAATENLALVLMPALCVVGGKFLFRYLLGAQSGFRLLILLGAFALFCLSFISAFYLLAMLGAYHVIHGAIVRYLRKRIGNDGENRDE